MLSLEDLQVISQRADEQRDFLTTEESIKTALVLPLIGALGYDYHNPSEVAAELAADVGTRSHEKVDYAILRDGKPIILFECKSLANSLGAGEMSQLTRYFNNTDADIGILTNGVVYKFFSDLDKPNIMDQSPFLEVDVRKADQSVVTELRRFAKGSFDPKKTKTAAVEANVIRGVKANLQRMYDNPEDEFSRSLLRDVVAGSLTKKVLESHREMVKRAFHQFVITHSGTGSSGEFSQEEIAGASQSAPEQATTATIPPSPSPGAQTDEWQSVSDIQPESRAPAPKQMMFPGEDKPVAIRLWSDVVIELVQWLIDNGRLGEGDFPIPHNESRYIVAAQPIHPDGSNFGRKRREVSSRCYVALAYGASGMADNARIVIARARMDASQFKVRW